MNLLPTDDVIRVPKWALAFVLPALAFLGLGARTEYRTDLNEAALRQLESRYEQHLSEERAANLNMRQQIQWLCVQRARDNREAGHAEQGPC